MQIKSNMGRSVENNEQIKCIDDKEFEDTAMHSFLLLSKNRFAVMYFHGSLNPIGYTLKLTPCLPALAGGLYYTVSRLLDCLLARPTVCLRNTSCLSLPSLWHCYIIVFMGT